MNNKCVYIHKRLDTNEVFYIGIGNIKRLYSKYKRNSFWKRIVEKTDYIIEIVYKNISWNEACKYEKELISLYGRKDLKEGTLVNLTNGGEGFSGYIFTKEHKQKLSISNKKKIVSDYTKELISKSKKNKNLTNIHKFKIGLKSKERGISDETRKKMNISNRKIIINLETGIFYFGIKEASEFCNINKNILKNYLINKTKNKSNLIYC